MERKRKQGHARDSFPPHGLFPDESGVAATEYGVMLTIAMLCVISIAGLGTVVDGVFNTAALGW